MDESSLDEEDASGVKEQTEQAGEVPLSDVEWDLDGEGDDDIIAYQKLTINHTTALTKAHKSITALSSEPFSAHQTVDSAVQTLIPNVHDDLNRELAFYKQALDASVEARQMLTAEGFHFTRPIDFFAEMVKSDEHMEKIKVQIMEDAASKKAALEARRQRALKKFGKQVQTAKLQERDRVKRETLEKINQLKRSEPTLGTR